MTEQAYIHPDQPKGQEYALAPTPSTTEKDQTGEYEIHQTINPSVNEFDIEQNPVKTESDELKVVVPVLAKEALFASALAGEKADTELIAGNLLDGVERLSSGISHDERVTMLNLAVESLQNAPSDNEIIQAQRIEIQRTQELVRQKNNHIAQLQEFLSPQLDSLRMEIMMLDEYDSRRSQLEAKADLLQNLIDNRPAHSQLPTDHTPTTDELEVSVMDTTSESYSPPRGTEISKILAQRAMGGVKGLFDKLLLDESELDEVLTPTKPMPVPTKPISVIEPAS